MAPVLFTAVYLIDGATRPDYNLLGVLAVLALEDTE